MVEGRVSVIIPGRCEDYFQQTIDSALERAAGDVEVMAVIDGYEPDPPLMARDDRVRLIKLDKSIGQRAAYNLGIRESTGEYVMKVDAHALMSPGYDETLKAYCPPQTTVLPEMRRLDVHKWVDKPRGRTHFMYFGLDLYCHYWKNYRKRPQAQGQYPEVMTGQGSCWFTMREWNDYVGLLDEGVGSWGNVGIEVSLRTWLCGGSLILNRNAWQAHWFRRDEGGFPYPFDGRHVAKAHRYTRDNYYFRDDAFEHQVRPFSWLIHHFAPVPGWEAYLADGFTVPRTIVYYTDGHLDEDLARACRKNLERVAANIPIISVSQTPLRFGQNVVVGEKPRSNRSIYEQILAGLEIAEPESVIYLCEHDIAYCPAHFAHVPEASDRIEFNLNRYYYAPGMPDYMPARGKYPLSQVVSYREYLMEQIKAMLAQDAPSSEMRDAKVKFFESERPNVDLRHGGNFSRDGPGKRRYYEGKATNTVRNLGHWGSPAHFLRKLGWNPQPAELSALCKLLQERHGLQRFVPAPVKVPGMVRPDLARLINAMGLRRGAEIGVLAGEHSEILCQEIQGCDLMCVDTWDVPISRGLYEMAKERLSPYGARLVKMCSAVAAMEVPDGSLDFVYIDADHYFDSVMEDLIAWSRKVRRGGIVSGHDYDRGHRKGVMPAVNAYTRAHHIREWFITDEKLSSFFWMKT